jgi:glucosylceramidase
MKKTLSILAVTLVCVLSCSSVPDLPPIKHPDGDTGPKVSVWTTYADRSLLFSSVSPITFKKTTSTAPKITVDTTTRYQTMDGFGYTLTGGSAMLLNQKMTASNRTALLRELFLTEQNGIGVSYLRVSIGASDLDAQVFSYNDLPPGETDVNLDDFSLDPDRVNLIPVLKQIVALNPSIKIMGSPWSAPKWMKTNNSVKGGSLKPEYYPVYAKYFVKYIQGMAAEGITIDAITIQNEPEHPGNTPSMTMTSSQQNEFIKSHLGPAFDAAGITAKIILFDHNCDNPGYPIAILNDAVTKPMVDGSAFHMYLGDISALTTVHNAHPDKNVYFTEQWTSGNGDFGGDLRWHVKTLIVGAPRNWSRNVLEWNLAADQNFDPHTNDGGCTMCQGALTINNTSGAVSRNVSYYIIAHASKLVPPGSVRIGSNVVGNLHNVAFLTPSGKKVLIVVNDNNDPATFAIAYKSYTATATLPAGAVATYYW